MFALIEEARQKAREKARQKGKKKKVFVPQRLASCKPTRCRWGKEVHGMEQCHKLVQPVPWPLEDKPMWMQLPFCETHAKESERGREQLSDEMREKRATASRVRSRGLTVPELKAAMGRSKLDERFTASMLGAQEICGAYLYGGGENWRTDQLVLATWHYSEKLNLSPKFWIESDLATKLRSKTTTVQQEVRRDLLCIDTFGTIRRDEDRFDVLSILRSRYRERRPTIIAPIPPGCW